MSLATLIDRAIAKAHTVSEAWSVFGPGALRVLLAKRLGAKEVEVNFRGIGSVAIRPKDSDFDVFWQVYVDRQYDISDTGQGERLRSIYDAAVKAGLAVLIIDAGANVGASSIWFAKTFPKAKVIAIEPDPGNAEMCRRNTSQCANVTVIEGALAGARGNVQLQKTEESWAVRTVRIENETGVPSYAIADIVDTVAEDKTLLVVKVDIEGFESDLFAGDVAWIDSAAAIFVEPHDWLYPNAHTSDSLQRTLFGRRFDLMIKGENLVLVDQNVEPKRWPARRSPVLAARV